MTRDFSRNFGLTVTLVALTLTLAACGGGSDSAASAESEATTTEETVTTLQSEVTEQLDAETETSGSESTGPAPAPGKGTLELDDGRSFAIVVTSCNLGESEGTPTEGSFEVRGTSEQSSKFDMTQFFLNGEWSQTDASLEFPNRDQVYVLAFAAGGAEPAMLDGRSISWTQTFKELDESANAHVYTGEGSLRLTCP